MNVVVLRFLIIGPAAGALGFVLADQLLDTAGASASSLAHPGSLVMVPVLWLYGLVLAYPLGLMPAGLSALAFTTLRRSIRVSHQLLIASALGFCFAALFGVAFFVASASPHAAISLLCWGIAGAFGGFGSALACIRVPLSVAASANVA